MYASFSLSATPDLCVVFVIASDGLAKKFLAHASWAEILSGSTR
jgi:hypothetical protein